MKKLSLFSAICAAAITAFCTLSPFTSSVRPTDVKQINADAIEYTRVYYTDENQIRYAVSMDNRTAIVTGYFGYGTELNIPSSINYPVTDNYTVEIPVTDFGISGYYSTYEGEPGNIYQIKKVTLPGSIEELSYTFTNVSGVATGRWSSLEEIVIEDGVKSIGFGLFYEAKNVRKVTIPASVTNIDSDAFYMDSTKNYRELGGVIYGYSGSTAEGFAKYNSIPFIPLDNAAGTTTTSATTPITTTTTSVQTMPDLELSATAITLKAGEQYTITANQSDLTYVSNNTDVAVVSKKGVITALSEGSALITVVNADGDAAQLRVTVSSQSQSSTAVPTTTTVTTTTTTTTVPSVPELKLSKTAVSLAEGEQYTITANQSDLTYVSNNTDVAVVSKKGIVTAISEGTAMITAINADGDTAQLRVTVTAEEDDYLIGDCNLDGKFNVADLVTLDKYLLGDKNITLYSWKAADICNDGVLDTYDITFMRYKLLNMMYLGF